MLNTLEIVSKLIKIAFLRFDFNETISTYWTQKKLTFIAPQNANFMEILSIFCRTCAKFISKRGCVYACEYSSTH